MVQKVFEGDRDTCQLLILRWLKIRTIHFPLFSPRNIDHVLFAKAAHFLSSKRFDGSKFE